MSRNIRQLIAFGPEAPNFGSWEWIGADIARALAAHFDTVTFRDAVPECDVCVFVKFKPSAEELRELSGRCRIVYAPVDIYGSAAEIDADVESLRCCSTVVAHCERLVHYFAPYAPTIYIDHHLKFIAPMPGERKTSGPILWIGNHSNLPPLVEWLSQHSLPEELWILTDLDEPSAANLGISGAHRVRVSHWSAERHVEWTSLARAAIDIKGDDFRARHKPPTKALDFIASGLPLAMNTGTSSGEHLAMHYGLQIPDPAGTDVWLSEEYWRQTNVVGQRLREELMLPSIADRWRQMLMDTLSSSRRTRG